MRVAYLVNQYPSVSHSFIRREIAALERLGLEIVRFSIRTADIALPDPADRREAELTCFVLDQGPARLIGSLAAFSVRHPARVFRAACRVWGMTVGGPRRLVRAIAYICEAAWLGRVMMKSGIAHIHAHFGTNSTTVARLTSGLTGIPYSFTAHGPEEFDSVKELGIAAKAHDAKFVAVISSFGRSQMFRHLSPEEWGKVEIVRCGLDFTAIAEVPVATTPEFDFCYVGRFAPQKGLPTLAEALREIAHRGENISLTMIGDGELFAWFAKFLASTGLADAVELRGVQGEAAVYAAIRASKAVLVPSYAEGLPVVIMEAFANRRAVVSTFVAGIPELVTPKCGILVPAGDAQALAEAMLKMKALSARELEDMGHHGFAQVRRRHDIAIGAALLHRRMMASADHATADLERAAGI